MCLFMVKTSARKTARKTQKKPSSQRSKPSTRKVSKKPTRTTNRNVSKKPTNLSKTTKSVSTPKVKYHPLRITKDKFINGLLKKKGFYKFAYVPLCIIIIALFVVFLFDMFIYSNYTISEIMNIKNTLLFTGFMIAITLINLFVFLYLGYKGAVHNFIFDKVFGYVLNIVMLITLIEVILTFISFVTFLSPFVIASFDSALKQQMYLLYLIAWVFVKSVLYLFMTSLSYLVFYKLRFVKL